MAYLATIQLIVTDRTTGEGVTGDPVRKVTEVWTPDGLLVVGIDHLTGEPDRGANWNILLAQCEKARSEWEG